MAAAKKRSSERTTYGESYSGTHTGLRRQLTQPLEEYDSQDRVAQAEGLSWAQWARAQLQLAVAKAESRESSAKTSQLRVTRADKRVKAAASGR